MTLALFSAMNQAAHADGIPIAPALWAQRETLAAELAIAPLSE